MKIGILYICIGKYDIFWENFYISSQKFFLPEMEKHYFVMTDSESILNSNYSDVSFFYQEDLGWPYNTLMRFYMFLKIEKEITEMDYLFFFNANLVFCTYISTTEFLPLGNKNLVAAIHPSYYNLSNFEFTYERNEKSTAYIPFGIGRTYTQGALLGGKTNYFIRACKKMNKLVVLDLENDVIAVWSDESHWNKYILKRKDVLFLSPAYIYPEDWDIPFEKKIISRDKKKFGGHNHLRNVKINT